MQPGSDRADVEDLWRQHPQSKAQPAEIDFSQPAKREEVRAEARIVERFHTAATAAGEAPHRHLRRRAEAPPADKRQRRSGRPPSKSAIAAGDARAKSVKAVATPPKTEFGTVDALASGQVGGTQRPIALRAAFLPQVDAPEGRVRVELLRTWTQASQHAYWTRRWDNWARKSGDELQGQPAWLRVARCFSLTFLSFSAGACAANGLWPGGQTTGMCYRLVLLEYAPASLRDDDWLGGTPPLNECTV